MVAIRGTLLILLLVFGISDVASAQVHLKKLGQSTMNFLKVSVAPRAASMGDAYTSVGGGAESMFYNPAGLADIEDSYGVFVANTQWIADISYTAGGIAKGFGNYGTVGLNVLAVDYGEITGAQLLSEADPQGYRETGELNVGAFAIGATYARRISSQFSMGGQIQYVMQSLGESDLGGEVKDNEAANIVGHFGMKFFPGFRSFRFAMSIRNFSSKATYEEVDAQLPLVFQVGVGMDVLDLFMGESARGSSFLVTSEFVHPNNYTERINLGGEYRLINGLVALRGGYQFNRDLHGISGGFGLNPEISGMNIAIDYSYSDMDVFDGVNRFSLGLSF